MPSLDSLPREIKLEIASYLSHRYRYSLKHVNRDFHRLLWKTTLFPDHINEMRDDSSLPILGANVKASEILYAMSVLEGLEYQRSNGLLSCGHCIKLLPKEKFAETAARPTGPASFKYGQSWRICKDCSTELKTKQVQLLRWLTQYDDFGCLSRLDCSLDIFSLKITAATQQGSGVKKDCKICQQKVALVMERVSREKTVL